jgi:uncharacterized protein
VGRRAEEVDSRSRAHGSDAEVGVDDPVCRRLDAIDWTAVGASLDANGFGRLPAVLTADECRTLASLYGDEARFRSRIEMARFRFGVGEYKYFTAPLPALVSELRRELYARLAPISNDWSARLSGERFAFPPTLDAFLERCHAAGQTRPTPLLLTYGPGGYNCLHQDIYGEVAFPLQVVFLLTRAGADYAGGEFLLVEQRPRAQSRGHALAVALGDGVIFATRERPVAGGRGDYRVVMRHGVSTVTSGRRMSLGIIFHDAR